MEVSKKKKKRIFVTTNIGSVLSKLESNSIHHSISPIGVSRHSCRELSRVRVRKGREILLSIFFFKARVPSNRNEYMQVYSSKWHHQTALVSSGFFQAISLYESSIKSLFVVTLLWKRKSLREKRKNREDSRYDSANTRCKKSKKKNVIDHYGKSNRF